MLHFVDETGLNRLPPGVYVQVYPKGAAQSSQTVVAAGFLDVTGSLAQSVQGAVEYTALFTGTQAPDTPQDFYGNANAGSATTVCVQGYRSPSLSQLGYTAEQMNLWVAKLVGDAGRAPGGNAYALAYGLAAALAFLDGSTQQILASDRLQTCSGSAIDSWAYDFFGKFLLRYPSEPDGIYFTRILTAFGPRCTLFAIQTIIQQYYAATAIASQQADETDLSYDTQGSFDQRGGLDVFVTPPSLQSLIPVVTVWDKQSNPTLAAQYSIAPPQFVVQIAFSGAAAVWFLDHSHLDFDTVLASGNNIQTLTTPPNAQVGALVNLVKSAGTQPLYQTYIAG